MKIFLNNVVLLLLLIFIYPFNMNASVDMLKIRMAVSDNMVSSNSVINSTQSQGVDISSSPVVSAEEGFNVKSYFSPKSNRDPFLSPVEYEQMRLMAEQKKREEEERMQAMIGKPVEKKKKEDPLKKYKLQGIVGKYAIINGEMVQEGMPYKKEFTLVKVYSGYVIIRYNGKNYKLIMK
ncbi:MAG: hypothetical protein KA059_01080 [Elusimicrobiales bacterium]|nr:hypothetical protein [Elusimicrobiales bacterium]